MGIWIRTGVGLGSIDAEDQLAGWGQRPMLLTHGTADTEDLPARTQSFFDNAIAAGIPAQLYWCKDSGHNAPGGMPVDVCTDAFADWLVDFFTRNLD